MEKSSGVAKTFCFVTMINLDAAVSKKSVTSPPAVVLSSILSFKPNVVLCKAGRGAGSTSVGKI